MFASKTKAALDLLSQAQKGGVLHLDDPSDPNHPGSPQSGMCLAASTPKVNRLMLRVFSPLPLKMHTQSSLIPLTPMSSYLLPYGPPGQQDLQGSMRTGGDICTPLSRVHLLTYAIHLPWWRKGSAHLLWTPSVFRPSLLVAWSLDKNPGVRPIGIGDTTRWIIAKAIFSIAKSDVQDASGCLQLCGGQLPGIEAAVEAVWTAFESDENEVVLLANASNAFNSLNRQVTLHNIRRLCPPLATILINTYRAPYGAICWWWCNTLPRRHYPGWPTCHAHVWCCDNPLDQETGWKLQTSVVYRWCGSGGEICRPTWLVGQAIRLRPWLRLFPKCLQDLASHQKAAPCCCRLHLRWHGCECDTRGQTISRCSHRFLGICYSTSGVKGKRVDILRATSCNGGGDPTPYRLVCPHTWFDE